MVVAISDVVVAISEVVEDGVEVFCVVVFINLGNKVVVELVVFRKKNFLICSTFNVSVLINTRRMISSIVTIKRRIEMNFMFFIVGKKYFDKKKL